MDEYRCCKCGAESTIVCNFKDNNRIDVTQYFCDECFMNLLLKMQEIATDCEVEEDV